ncbi:putative required for proper assembly of pre-ribosomal particles during the biogenesis of the 60S ribosomal subunit [Lyophyllum shimeji]|uniref:Required for proper assembly of pre-ribosomal particles during the biogenesis of the 60S ribosomal subunit n=1 Tax=Lyophyllum shimeji TaxID=47721 RepID=A0A9P3UK34_LYOSH|nr:putative required for proper assembly of pre-ribosomal particles during the biogenesis of the 60S ribosomal subunit [Lyophyllum shimeji]
MGKVQKKTGKGRLDKYYKLAKEQGYRARSAFKLIQLNKKYAFLETARCTIDLCAAPGGWLQVASKYMPANSIIVGVDLVPIKPIPRVVTFAADITTPQCRNLLRGELKDWKADVVLHDGAPNVGTAWIQDAYSQAELVLMSLKLAVEFLAKGGTFVTKVFRSVDYNSLIWVFNQLFGKVEATKPPSSRNVSAEIFVVCRDFLAPKSIDPKFLDPRHVFKEVAAADPAIDKGSSANNVQANVFQPEKKRRHRDGYADGDYTLHKTINATDFVKGKDPIAVLGTANKIAFLTEEEREWFAMDITTSDIKANCEDLKVLGKGDFKSLLKWRSAIREELGLDNRTKETEELTETVEIVEDVDEEHQISEELERLNAEAAARMKRERRRANELKTRTIQRMQLQMTAPLDIGLEQQDLALGGQDDMFDLGGTERGLRKTGGIERLIGDDGDAVEESEEEEVEENDGEVLDSEEERERKVDGLEAELDGLYDAYQERLRERDTKFKVKEARRARAEREDWSGIQSEHGSDDESGSEEEGGWDKMQEAKEDVSDDETSNDEDIHSSGESTSQGVKRPRGADRASPSRSSKRVKLVTKQEEPKLSMSSSKAAQLWFSQDVFSGLDDVDADDHEPDADSKDAASAKDWESAARVSEDDDDFEVVPQEPDAAMDMWEAENENVDEIKQAEIRQFGLYTPETVTLAQQLVNRQTTKTQLINDGFNRYSLNSKEGLPSWFLDDEAKFYKPNLPVTKEAVIALRQKQRALDARPIKKIAEAKARKKFKAQQRLEKALKKAEGVNATTDMSEREKAQQIEKLMRKGMSSGQKAKKDIKVVVAKGAHKGIKGRPKGVKGRYAMVDARMRKELRAKKRKEKAKKNRRKT